ncbi:dihydroorotase [Verrucomicrobia bacterium LW23]|nr:dihydroorotase [Verrucomicrobia bacterium LW23]
MMKLAPRDPSLVSTYDRKLGTRSWALTGGRVIDPANRRDEIGEVYVRDGKIVAEIPVNESVEVIDCSGLIVCPGLIDLHVHLREPGQGSKETVATGTRAAAAGGFSTIVAMPNTKPVADGPNTIAWLRQRIAETAIVNVYTTGCISQNMAGEALAPIGSLKQAGVVAITDDGKCIQNNELMRRALEYAQMFDLPLLDHCQDYALSEGGVMNEGYWSTVLGLQGWPAIAEEVIVGRNALLAELTGGTVHCQHLSSAGSVRLVREAMQRGVKISAEVMPHHLALTDESIAGYDTNFKMNPPLRTKRDIAALLEGVADGTIEILGSDHAPHATYEKEVEFSEAPFGILGLETELSLFVKTLIEPGVISWAKMIEKLTINPAKLLRLDKGTLSPGADADITLIDPAREWVVDKEKFQSKSRNTPFHGWELKGKAVATVVAGEFVFSC